MIEWFEDIFDKYYVMFDGHRDTSQEISAVEKLLDIMRPANILDLCCGYGRHAIELATRGFKVTGLDLSKYLLSVAKRDAERKGITVEFVRCDMRRMSYDGRFDAVINLFTSFGYFVEGFENEKVAEAIYKALRPSGSFLLDQANKFSPGTPEQMEIHKELKGIRFTKRSTFNKATGNYAGTYRYEFQNNPAIEHPFSIKIYSVNELKKLFESVAFRDIHFFGDYQGHEFEQESPRIIMLACK